MTFTAVVSSSHEYLANVSQLAGHEFRRRSAAIAEVLDASLKKRWHSVLAADPTGRGCFSKYCMTCITTPSVAGRLRILNDLDGREREMHPWVCRIIVGVLERQPRRPPPRRGGVGAVLAVFRGQDTATSAGAGRRAVALSSQMRIESFLVKKISSLFSRTYGFPLQICRADPLRRPRRRPARAG